MYLFLIICATQHYSRKWILGQSGVRIKVGASAAYASYCWPAGWD